MLILTRRRNEGLTLTLPDGRLIRILVVEFRGDKCRIGVTCDPDIPVHRDEVGLLVLNIRSNGQDDCTRPVEMAATSGSRFCRRPAKREGVVRQTFEKEWARLVSRRYSSR